MTIDKKKWYTIKVQFNQERLVKTKLGLESNRNNLDFNILIPFEKSFMVKNGKKYNKEKLLYPGYIFVETQYVGELQYILRGTPGNTGIIKNKSGEPQTLSENEIQKMLEDYKVETEKEKIEFYKFSKGETVKITSGPFVSFNGVISELNDEKNKVTLSVSIFGRPTKVELELMQIEKIIE